MDGRPEGCKCPADPGYNRLPSDNKHHGSKRCPLTAKVNSEELARLNQRVDDLTIALQVLAP